MDVYIPIIVMPVYRMQILIPVVLRSPLYSVYLLYVPFSSMQAYRSNRFLRYLDTFTVS
jgi:hypothetical protein